MHVNYYLILLILIKNTAQSISRLLL